MLWLIAGGCTVAVSLTGGWLIWHRRRVKPDATTYHVTVALHVIRRRFDVFQFKVETRREVAIAERQLGEELSELDERDRSQP